MEIDKRWMCHALTQAKRAAERNELLLFPFKLSQPRIDSGEIMKFISAAVLIRHELEVV